MKPVKSLPQFIEMLRVNLQNLRIILFWFIQIRINADRNRWILRSVPYHLLLILFVRKAG